MDVDAALLKDIKDDLDECPDVPVNVGIIGRAGVGKTEFIRAILANEMSAAVSRERKDTPYIFRTVPNVFFFELRCVENPADEYLKAIQVDKYDFFLMLCDTEFGKTEFWLAEHFQKRNKGFFLVRTKVDKVIPDPSSTDEIPETLFQEVSTKFAKYPTFAITNKTSGVDFPKLKTQLLFSLISLKRFASVGYDSESVKRYLESKLDEWKEARIEVGIIGETGSGKSSFINAIRNLKPSDPGAAEVGVKETTLKPTWFPHPDNGSIRLWDLPGVGSPSCAKNIYLEKVNVDIYDFFLIVSARRFTADDRWLVEQLRKREKTYFFVRTKFDEAVGDEDNEEKIRDIIIQDIKKKINLPDIRIYLLSSLYRDRFDFPQLLEDLICALPSLKQKSLALTLSGYSKGIIEMKKKALKSRILKAAFMSGGVGALPVPGIDVAVDLGIFVHETRLYRQTFGLNEASLRLLAEEFHLDTDRLKSAATKTGAMSLTKTGIKSGIFAGRIGLALATKTGVTSVLEVVVPVVGSVVSGGISFAMIYGFLNKMLDDFASDAIAVYNLCADKVLADNTASTAQSE